jgi:hypothetical protein
MLTMKAMPAGGLDVPSSAPNWNDSQLAGRVTVSDSGEPVRSVPATVRVAACWPELGPDDAMTAEDGAAVVRGSSDDGAATVGETTAVTVLAAGLQAVLDTTIAAALKTTLSVLFTD